MEEASAFGRSGYEEEEEMMTKPDTELLNKVEFFTRHHLLDHHNNKSENGRCSNDANIQPSSSSLDQRNSRRLSSKTQQQEEEEVIESARAELGEMKEENKRLKKYLDEVISDYKTLQTQLINKRGHDKLKVAAAAASTSLDIILPTDSDRETELVSLSLGISSSGVVSRFDSSKDDEKMKNKAGSSSISSSEEEGGLLRLGLECKLLETTVSAGNAASTDQSSLPKPSPTTSICSSFGDEAKQEEELLVGGGADADDDHDTLMPPHPNKLGGSKTMRNNNNAAAAAAVQVSNKRARVSVRSRCNTPTMNDGCQWRKYGQKIAKGNPCPRAYYRCTVAPSCPVRKQVQRCSQDMSILTTTYEGTHNHPLSMSATAMASTTSAAAQMLLSGSSSSSSIPSSSLGMGPTRPVTDYLHGLNPNYNNYLDHQYSKPTTTTTGTMMRSPPFYFPTTSVSSASSSCPTITLDLTSSNHHLITRFNPTSTLFPTPAATPSSTTSLSFNTINSSSDQNPSTTSSSLFSNWPMMSSGTGIINSYGQLYGKTQQTSSSPYQQLPCNSSSSNIGRNQQNNIIVQQDTIAAATKAITADPNFQSALAAALKSIINTGAGGSGDQGSGNHRAPQ